MTMVNSGLKGFKSAVPFLLFKIWRTFFILIYVSSECEGDDSFTLFF